MSPRPLRFRSARFVVCVVGAVLGVWLCGAPTARADAGPGPGAPPVRSAYSTPVDVTVQEPRPERRIVAIEWNPVALFVARLSANVEIVPVDHHALILNGYAFDTTTAATDEVTVSQRFDGVGGEIGYRYYSRRGGPQGFFVGPSFVAADVKATPAKGPTISLINYGAALDAGWQAVVASRWVVSLGGGAEIRATNRAIPEQQAPASYYADRGVHPRALAAFGCAF